VTNYLSLLVFFILVDSSASEIYMSTFRNTLFRNVGI